MCSSCASLFAVKKAIVAARKEIDNKDFFPLGEYPATVCERKQELVYYNLLLK